MTRGAYPLMLAACLALVPAGVPAQEDDEAGGFLVRLLEDNLSGDSRYIRVRGLEGALSARATIQEITVSDDDGVWLTVRDAALDWNRLALIRGRFSVNELTAGEITVARRPTTTSEAEQDLPSAGAQPFQLPELPVAIELGEIRVDTLSLGADLAGVAAELQVAGALSLAEGALDSTLSVTRLDRPGDRIGLEAQFDNETSVIGLDIGIVEDGGGLIGTALSIPDAPPLELTARGEGPVTDFTADIALATEAVRRVSGQVRLRGIAGDAGPSGIGFTVDLGGDVTPLLQPEYDAFFGSSTTLFADGRKEATGALVVEELRIASEALTLTGALATGADGALDRVALNGEIVPPEGVEVVLPVADPRVVLARARIAAGFDRARGNTWSLDLETLGIGTPDMALGQAVIAARGTLDQTGTRELRGSLRADLSGLELTDASLDRAVGPRLVLDGDFDLIGDDRLNLTGFVLEGEDYEAKISTAIDGLSSGFELDGDLEISARDISRFSGLAGRDLGGAVTATLSGRGSPLAGSFDAVAEIVGTDLQSGMAGIDPLIAGRTKIALDAARGPAGLTVRRFALNGPALTASAALDVTEPEGVLTVSGDGRLSTTDLSPFSTLAGMDLGGALSATFSGSGAPRTRAFDLTLDLDAGGLRTGLADIDPIIEGDIALAFDAANGPEGLVVRSMALDATAVTASGTATISGIETGNYAGSADLAASVPDLSRFAGLAGMDLGGRVSVTAEGTGALETRAFDIRLDLDTGGLRTGRPDIDPLIEGDIALALDAANGPEGLEVRSFTYDGGAIDARAAATVTGIVSGDYAVDGNVEASVSDLSLFSRLSGLDLGGAVTARADGSAALGDRSFDLALDADGRDLRTGIEQADRLIEGRTTLRLDAARDGGGIEIRELRLDGTALTAEAQGALREAGGRLTFSAALDDLQRVTTVLQGPLTIEGDVARTATGVDGEVRVTGPQSSYAQLAGPVDFDGAADLTFDTRIERIDRFIPDFPGTLTAEGKARRDGTVWTIDGTAEGPAGIATTVAGSFDEADGMADLAAKGQVSLAIANRYIVPNRISGTAGFDFALRGAPGLDALSGTISTSGTSLALPSATQTLNDISGTVTIADSRAVIDLGASVRAGGGLTISGPVALTPPFDGNISVALNQLVLTDNVIYETVLNGGITMSGPLAGNSRIAGDIQVGETNFSLAAATGAAGAAPIPDIVHIGEPGPVLATRSNAQLVRKEDAGDGRSSTIGLDVGIVAPNRVFVRGRGLFAELGGTIRIGGTTADIRPAGQIELIRGNFDILGRRLALNKGLVSLQGNLTPYLEFVSSSSTSEGTASIEISGPLDLPEVRVYADPERPPEEALAMLLFGNSFAELSPFVVAQMAASLAQLSGAGGDTTKGVREETGVDNIDVGSAEGGGGRLGAGAYLGENLYTDVSVSTKGDTELNLNLDVTETITLRGTVDNRGETGIGVFFQRDY